MSEIIVHANKKLKTINAEFQENFTYLMLAFFSQEDLKKLRRGEPDIYSLDDNLFVRDVRTTKPEEGQEISIRGNTLVGNLEDRFVELFGIHAQVSFMDSTGKPYISSDKEDKMTLTALNEYVKREGCQEYPSNEGDVDNSSVKTDQVTAMCRDLHENLGQHISGLVPVAAKHYASGQRVDAYREYYADIDDEHIEYFMLEWDSEEEKLYVGFCVIPPDKNKTTFKEKLAAACAKQGIGTDEYGCFNTIENMEYDSFRPPDDKMIEDGVKLFKALKTICKSLR